MKIISKPDVSGWNLKHTCHICSTVFLVEPQDIQYRYYDGDWRDQSYEQFTCACPTCGNGFQIKTSDIPVLIQLDVKKKRK